MAYTLTYSESAEGWVSFYSFLPDWIIGMNNYLYTFKGGNLYRHNSDTVSRNNFYGVQYNTTLKSVFNESPLENKLFKTIHIEGDATWDVELATDLQNTGNITASWFERKEASYYAFIRNGDGTVAANPPQYMLRSLNGIGQSTLIQLLGNIATVNFSINPYIDIGSILSIGDYLYFADNPSGTITPTFFGVVTDIEVDIRNGLNRLRVDIVGPPVGSLPTTNNPYILYIKNSLAESHGVLGHYCVFDIENASTSKIELFMLGADVMKSYP